MSEGLKAAIAGLEFSLSNPVAGLTTLATVSVDELRLVLDALARRPDQPPGVGMVAVKREVLERLRDSAEGQGPLVRKIAAAALAAVPQHKQEG